MVETKVKALLIVNLKNFLTAVEIFK